MNALDDGFRNCETPRVARVRGPNRFGPLFTFGARISHLGVIKMNDLVIRGGKIVDGTGKESFNGDIAMKDGVITEVGKSKF